ncbi:hypothetical protein A2755_00715 [Candidatus Wolfebacteria bacterium RIFCSPHIGHO2_01_FULL_48_22]|uniref:PKD/Chitinase domain-containing protein n=1 Tax=Candidatus Wolfebacteria bacterium RIFCSPHIGHO2_01_FULL_48_22 TaxID=1802555 RepID=A0A1F8DTT5_9BACT|nr:MAG: hypothetical protein A2755_00715 [Candidatus Wolfebacteria bacterium RIFCSPHIGHO2_01_FULL_48_22]
MRYKHAHFIAIFVCVLFSASIAGVLLTMYAPDISAARALPIRGIVLTIGGNNITQETLDFIRYDLKNEGVNTIVFNIGYHYPYLSHPDISESIKPTLSQTQQLVAVCHEAGMNCIPGMQLLTHQSYTNYIPGLLRVYPQFDANPGRPVSETRSYNPYYPGIHDVVFDLVDELISVFGATDFLAGFDEVRAFPELATPQYPATPYYNGQPWSEVYAYEYEIIRQHLASKGVKMWIWGDELLKYDDWVERDSQGNPTWPSTEIQYESDVGTGYRLTSPAINAISRDNVMIADWHYYVNPATPEYFASKGFDVVSAPWTKKDVALGELNRHINANSSISPHMKGILQTTWVDVGDFIKAYKYGDGAPLPSSIYAEETICYQGVCFSGYALNSANAFKAIMATIRSSGTPSPSPSNLPPSVSIGSPSNNSSHTAGLPLTVFASASDSDGSITKVEFFRGTTKLGEDTAAPYQYTWSNPPAGSYVLTAKATDNQNFQTTSVSVTIAVTSVQTTSSPIPQENVFGLVSGNSTYMQHANALQAMRFQNTVGNGILTKLELLVDDATPSGMVRMGVYADANGVPGDLLLDAGEATVSNGWVSAPSVLSLQNSYYWIAYILQHDNGIRYQTDRPANSHRWADNSMYGVLPMKYPSGSGVGFNTNQYTMKATVVLSMTPTPSATVIPPPSPTPTQTSTNTGGGGGGGSGGGGGGSTIRRSPSPRPSPTSTTQSPTSDSLNPLSDLQSRIQTLFSILQSLFLKVAQQKALQTAPILTTPSTSSGQAIDPCPNGICSVSGGDIFAPSFPLPIRQLADHYPLLSHAI